VGQVNLVNDESWRAAWQVVRHFHDRLDDDELVEAFHAVRAVIAAALTRCLERSDRELGRLARGIAPPATPSASSSLAV
jgi:hypothetical protein